MMMRTENWIEAGGLALLWYGAIIAMLAFGTMLVVPPTTDHAMFIIAALVFGLATVVVGLVSLGAAWLMNYRSA